MVKIIIYTWSYCPYCKMAKNLLKSLNLDFKEINVENSEKLKKLKEKTNYKTVPQIFINDKFIGGFDNLFKLKESGELENILN